MRSLLFATALAVSTAGAQTTTESLIVSTEWLARRLNDPSIVVLEVVHDESSLPRRTHSRRPRNCTRAAALRATR